MLYIVESDKPVATAARDLEAAVQRHGFGVLHVHNLQQTLKAKGIDFPHACLILEVCNPQQALRVLSQEMAVNLALPCRISVYEEGGRTKIGMVKPTALLALFPTTPSLQAVAEEVERETIAMIEEAR
ncbi:MAG: hypothetical protein KatS3mg131_1401 [Candidatus Tectimicrobiota bacterium]|nr:MAG: hypothetical protein KatS3mg131_1401 [Candidatus Tectomicrobia bacterium]